MHLGKAYNNNKKIPLKQKPTLDRYQGWEKNCYEKEKYHQLVISDGSNILKFYECVHNLGKHILHLFKK